MRLSRISLFARTDNAANTTQTLTVEVSLMKKKMIVATLAVLGLTIYVFAFGRRPQVSVQAAPQLRPEIPANVTYKHLFHHVMVLKRKAEEVEREGKDGRQFRTHFIRQATLTQEEAQVLEQVAVECEQAIQLLELRAKPVVDAYRAQYPGGQVPQGQHPAPPPPELRKISEERDAIILQARDRLHVALGDEKFTRFDSFVKTRVTQITPEVSPR